MRWVGRVFCINCGRLNVVDRERHCADCGARLTAPEAVEKTTRMFAAPSSLAAEQDKRTLPAQAIAALKSLPPGVGLLVCTDGPAVFDRYPVASEVTTAGRHPDSDILLDDNTVSLRHAEFRRTGHTVAVRDLGSRSGTYVNRERVEEKVLAPRDEICIGAFRLTFLTR